MNKIDYLQKARIRYTDQHSEDQIFDAIVQLMIYQSMLNQDTLIDLEETVFDIDKSTGAMLDLIGYIVGQSRIINGTGEFFGFFEDPSALGFGSVEDPEMGGFWYSLGSGMKSTITVAKDDVYRRLIKARIVYNNNMATPDTLLRIINLLTDSTSARFTEDNKGNVILFIDEDKDGLVTYFLSIRDTEENLIPVTLGVSISLNTSG